MEKDRQILIGIGIGIIILLLQAFVSMFDNYMDSQIIATDYVPYSEDYGFYTYTIKEYLDNNYSCEYRLHWLKGGGYSKGDDYCYNENQTIRIYWDFEINQEIKEIYYK